MTKPMSLADRLSGMNLPSRFAKSARARRRPVNKRWFVHDYLGAYSYAFSVDDQYGNVLVGNATGFQVAVGGPEGIVEQTPFKTGE
jgi:hypothetical protein